MKGLLILSVAALTLANDGLASEKEFTKQVLAPRYAADAGVKLQDGTAVDLTTSRFVVTISFTSKWCDAIGRALYVSHLSGKPSVIVLLRKDCDSEAERLDILRCQSLARLAGIVVVVEDYSPPPYDKQPTPADVPPKRAPQKT